MTFSRIIPTPQRQTQMCLSIWLLYQKSYAVAFFENIREAFPWLPDTNNNNNNNSAIESLKVFKKFKFRLIFEQIKNVQE